MDYSIDISPLLAATNSLDEALLRSDATPADDMLRDACIQRFEYCYELAWKTMKRILSHQGLEVNSPRPVFRQAAKEGLISDPETWFEFLEKRNLTVHTYNAATAADIRKILPEFQRHLHRFIATISKP